MNTEMLAAIKTLCDLIKADPIYKKMEEASKLYESSDKISTAMTEYNVQQTALCEEYAKDEGERDTGLIDSIQGRINELYREIIADPTYEVYKNASDEYQEFYNGILSQMQYLLTGKTACSGDCASCGGCH